MWSVASGETTPPGFRYLMFPVDGGVAMFGSKGGEEIGTLDRAMANRHAELGGEWTRLMRLGPGAWVRMSDLRFLPPAGASVDFAGEWRAARMEMDAGEGDPRFVLREVSGGLFEAELRMAWLEGEPRDFAVDRFVYTTDGTTVTARLWTRTNRDEHDAAKARNVLASIGLGVAAAGAAGFLVRNTASRGKRGAVRE